MRRLAAALALTLLLAACNALRTQVPLDIDETPSSRGWGCSILLYQIIDVVADPETGSPVVKEGVQIKWPKGYTAWRAPWSETEVVDPSGKTVLTTGGRYYMCPEDDYLNGWVVGLIEPCPPGEQAWGKECEIGGGPR